MCVHLPKVDFDVSEDDLEYTDGPLSSVMMFVVTVALAILVSIAVVVVVR